jgi:hypothetical protein
MIDNIIRLNPKSCDIHEMANEQKLHFIWYKLLNIRKSLFHTNASSNDLTITGNESKCTVRIFGHSPRSEFPRHWNCFPAVTNSKKHHNNIDYNLYAPREPGRLELSQHPGLITRVISLSCSRIRTVQRWIKYKSAFPHLAWASVDYTCIYARETENKAEEREREKRNKNKSTIRKLVKLVAGVNTPKWVVLF